MAGALIIVAELAKPDFVWLDSLCRRHYPPERNRLPAHLTLFHSLPPSAEAEVRRRLARAASAPAPAATIAGAMDLGSGVAIRVESQELEQVRDELAGEFRGLLTAQDLGPWTPHVTIQNKVEPRVARTLFRDIRTALERRPLRFAGLLLIRYAKGEWEPLANYRFRGA